MDVFAIGGDHVNSDYTFAGDASFSAVPPIATLQQIATNTNAFAVPGWKKQLLFVQFRQQMAATYPRACRCRHCLGVDFITVEMFHHDHDAVLPQMIGTPTVSTRTNGDFFASRFGVFEGSNDVAHGFCLNNGSGPFPRVNFVEQRTHRRRFKIAIAALNDPSVNA